MTRTVAAFDFDGTLTRRDTLLEYVASVIGWPRVVRALLPAAPALRGNRDAAKEKFVGAALAGMSRDALRAAGASYARTVKISPEMQARVAWHRREGHDVVIVSAALDLYLVDVAARLGADHVLCTALEVDADNRVTGRLLGGNCRGAEKAKRLRDYLDGDEVALWAYGDSSGDDEMLAMADYPVRVKRGRLTASRPGVGSGPREA